MPVRGNVRFYFLLSVAAVVSAAILGLLIENKRWNNPGAAGKTVERQIMYHGIPLHLTVTCRCPDYLIQSEKQQVAFEVSATVEGQESISTGGPATPAKPALAADMGSAAKEKLWIAATIDNQDSDFADARHTQFLVNGSDLREGAFASVNGALVLSGKGTATNVGLHVYSTDLAAAYLGTDWGSVVLTLESRPTFYNVASPYLAFLLVFLVLAGVIFFADWRIREANAKREEKIARAKELADKNPEHARFAWQLARTRLEAYFDKNIFQVNLVFWLAVIVMMAGFLVVLWGIKTSFEAGKTTGSTIAAVAGVITQFLGATFLVIYRSTMKQANDFITVLDRINNVGMAVQVLDQIADDPAGLKNEVRARMVDRLLTVGRAAESPNASDQKLSQHARSTKAKVTA